MSWDVRYGRKNLQKLVSLMRTLDNRDASETNFSMQPVLKSQTALRSWPKPFSLDRIVATGRLDNSFVEKDEDGIVLRPQDLETYDQDLYEEVMKPKVRSLLRSRMRIKELYDTNLESDDESEIDDNASHNSNDVIPVETSSSDAGSAISETNLPEKMKRNKSKSKVKEEYLTSGNHSHSIQKVSETSECDLKSSTGSQKLKKTPKKKSKKIEVEPLDDEESTAISSNLSSSLEDMIDDERENELDSLESENEESEEEESSEREDNGRDPEFQQTKVNLRDDIWQSYQFQATKELMGPGQQKKYLLPFWLSLEPSPRRHNDVTKAMKELKYQLSVDIERSWQKMYEYHIDKLYKERNIKLDEPMHVDFRTHQVIVDIVADMLYSMMDVCSDAFANENENVSGQWKLAFEVLHMLKMEPKFIERVEKKCNAIYNDPEFDKRVFVYNDTKRSSEKKVVNDDTPGVRKRKRPGEVTKKVDGRRKKKKVEDPSAMAPEDTSNHLSGEDTIQFGEGVETIATNISPSEELEDHGEEIPEKDNPIDEQEMDTQICEIEFQMNNQVTQMDDQDTQMDFEGE